MVDLPGYNFILKKEIGLLINFGPARVDVKRKYRNPMTDSKTLAEGKEVLRLREAKSYYDRLEKAY